MKIIATLDTADFSDCTHSGYRFCLYSDGHLSAEYMTRWQGSRTGTRYVTDPGHVDVSTITPDDPDNDALALLTNAVRDVQPSEDRDWRQTRRGILIR
jgi:hypothetical protein